MAAAPGIGCSDMLDNPLFSDIKIRQTHKGVTKEYHAHKAVLCAASPWFHNLLTNIYDGVSGVIEIPDDEPHHFKAMLRFMYTLELDHSSFGPNEPRIDYLLDIHSLAGKYEVRGLQARCGEDYPLAEDEEWDKGYGVECIEAIINQHYSACFDTRCIMGRRICSFLIEKDSASVHDPRCLDLLRNWPRFAQDMLFGVIDIKGGQLY